MGGPRPEGLGLLVDELLGQQHAQELVERPPREDHIGGKVAVGCMGDLVDVVADTPKLGEQRRIHDAVGRARAHVDLAVKDKAFAQS